MKARRARGLWLGCWACLIASAGAAQGGFDPYGDSLSSLDTQLGDFQRKLKDGRARRAEASQRLAWLGPSVDAAREHLQRDARALYRVSRGGMLPLAGGMSSLLNHASRVGRLSHIVERDLVTLSELGKGQTMLQKELASIDVEIAAAERELASLELARAKALRDRATHASFQAALASSRLADRPSLSATSSSTGDSDRVQYGLSVIGGVAGERFNEQRGTLALPVSGPSSIQDANRVESDGPGLEFAAHSGAAVRAAAAGRVAFSDTYGSYGRMVIIDHGDRYYTVYGGLAHLEVQVGDELSKSARLGTTSTAPLYFEVRRGSKTQDARAWLGL